MSLPLVEKRRKQIQSNQEKALNFIYANSSDHEEIDLRLIISLLKERAARVMMHSSRNRTTNSFLNLQVIQRCKC